MKLIGIMPCKNEGWILGVSARVALEWCDELIVGFHDCDDDSLEIADDIIGNDEGARVMLPSGEWREMEHRQILLTRARKHGATHIAIIDADEILTANLWKSIRGMMPQSPGFIVQLPGYNLRGGLYQCHDNGVWGQRWFSTAFMDAPQLRWSGDKFHSREPEGLARHAVQPVAQGGGGVLHLWGASERRLIAKHALYKMTERLRWPEKRVADIDQMYSWAIKGEAGSYGTPATWTYAQVPPEWWTGIPLQYLDLDREPWQEKACVELMKEHGPRTFAGLDLFGVV